MDYKLILEEVEINIDLSEMTGVSEFKLFGITDKSSGVYVIKSCEEDIYYIGSTFNLKSRIRQHYLRLKNQKHHTKYLQSYFNKYGENCLVLVKVYTCRVEDLECLEQTIIDTYKENYVLFNSHLIAVRHTSEGNIEYQKSQLSKIIDSNGKTQYENLMNTKSVLRLGCIHTNSIAKVLKVNQNFVIGLVNKHWKILNDDIVDVYISENKLYLEQLVKNIQVLEIPKKDNNTKYPLDYSIINKIANLHYTQYPSMRILNRDVNQMQFNKMFGNYTKLNRSQVNELKYSKTYEKLPNDITKLNNLLTDKDLYNKMIDNIQDIDELIFFNVQTKISLKDLLTCEYIINRGFTDIPKICKLLSLNYYSLKAFQTVSKHMIQPEMLSDYIEKNLIYLEDLYNQVTKMVTINIRKGVSTSSQESKDKTQQYIDLVNAGTSYEDFNKLGFTKVIRQRIRKTVCYKELMSLQNKNIGEGVK